MRKLGWVRQSSNGIVGTDFDHSVGLVISNANASARVGDEDDGIHKDTAEILPLPQPRGKYLRLLVGKGNGRRKRMSRVESPSMLVASNGPGEVLDLDVINGVTSEHNNVVLVWEFPGARTGLEIMDDAMIRRKVLGKILDRCRLALGLRFSDAVNLGHVVLGRHLFVCWICVWFCGGEEATFTARRACSRCQVDVPFAAAARRPSCLSWLTD